MTTPHGESTWIAAVLERHGGELVRYAVRLLRDPGRAQDVVQETFLRLCQQRESDLDGRLVPWLFAVCRNVALDIRRKEHRMSSLNDTAMELVESPQMVPEQTLERQETTGVMLHALSQLPVNQQEVIRLKFQQGLSYKQISSITGHSVSHVGVLIHTGMKQLRELGRQL